MGLGNVGKQLRNWVRDAKVQSVQLQKIENAFENISWEADKAGRGWLLRNNGKWRKRSFSIKIDEKGRYLSWNKKKAYITPDMKLKEEKYNGKPGLKITFHGKLKRFFRRGRRNTKLRFSDEAERYSMMNALICVRDHLKEQSASSGESLRRRLFEA